MSSYRKSWGPSPYEYKIKYLERTIEREGIKLETERERRRRRSERYEKKGKKPERRTIRNLG